MAKDSKVNLKMLLEILTDKEIEEFKERAIRHAAPMGYPIYSPAATGL